MFGFFKRKATKAPRARPRRSPMVEVSYRELHEAPRERGYVFVWKLPPPPNVGDRVFVRGGDGRLEPAVVINADAAVPDGYSRDELAEVLRLATDEEMERAREKLEREMVKEQRDEVSWLNMARRAAGLPTPGRARSAPPEGHQAIPPTEGIASKSEAHRRGGVWWRAMKRAEEHGRPADEIATFRAIAQHWYSVRDRSTE